MTLAARDFMKLLDFSQEETKEREERGGKALSSRRSLCRQEHCPDF